MQLGQRISFFIVAPTRGPDIWRERSPSGKSLRIFWKVDRKLKVLTHGVI